MIFIFIRPENPPVYTQEDKCIILLNKNINEILLRHPDADLFLAGDLNSRIKNMQGFIPADDVEFVFGDTDYPIEPFDIVLKSIDETCNRFGTSLIDLCCTQNIHLLNSRLFKDINREITCVANNGRIVVY